MALIRQAQRGKVLERFSYYDGHYLLWLFLLAFFLVYQLLTTYILYAASRPRARIKASIQSAI